MTLTLEWDGADRVGPVHLGMTLDECRKAIPGVYDDSPTVSDPEIAADLESATAWWSDEYGVMVALDHDLATGIFCNDHFIWQGTDLIGGSQGQAIALLGGFKRLSEDLAGLLIVETELGPEVWSKDGIVTCISISRYEDD